jgi:hypothetical protein
MLKVVDTVEEVVTVLEPHIANFRKVHGEAQQRKSGAKKK